MKNYDVIIIGAGPGGYVAAIKAAQKKLKTALIEKDTIGGVCLNWGCIPTKAFMKSVKVYQSMQHAKDYGLIADKEAIGFDWQAIMKRKNLVVKRLTGGVSMLLKKNGVDVYQGEATVTSPHEVSVNDETLATKHLILSTGASPVFPDIEGLKDAYASGFVKTNRELMDIEQVPKRLVIIGGCITNVPIATIFNRFGTQVTILEPGKTFLPEMDGDAREAFIKQMKRAKINVITETTVKKIGKGSVDYTDASGETYSLEVDSVLLSLAMQANTNSFTALKLKMVNGSVDVDTHMETSIPGVYAVGDVNGKMLLAHVASHEGLIAVDHITGGKDQMDYSRMPQAVYGIPEVAWVGLTEEKAKARELDYKVSVFPLQANGRALADGERDGFIKILATKPYNEIVGVHIMAENAADLISEAVVAINLEATAEELVHSVHPHPTVSEIFNEAAHGLVDFAIHI